VARAATAITTIAAINAFLLMPASQGCHERT
jgi:hypothetical protein